MLMRIGNAIMFIVAYILIFEMIGHYTDNVMAYYLAGVWVGMGYLTTTNAIEEDLKR